MRKQRCAVRHGGRNYQGKLRYAGGFGLRAEERFLDLTN